MITFGCHFVGDKVVEEIRTRGAWKTQIAHLHRHRPERADSHAIARGVAAEVDENVHPVAVNPFGRRDGSRASRRSMKRSQATSIDFRHSLPSSGL